MRFLEAGKSGKVLYFSLIFPRYQDVKSLYPSVQIKYDYPVGLPRIHVWDPKYYPCNRHAGPERGNSFDFDVCDCAHRIPIHGTQIVNDVEWTAEQAMSDDFFGFACVSMFPPKNLFHPVLVQMDPDTHKCTASLNTILEGFFFTEEIKLAMKHGYILKRIHRFDQYHRGNIWRDFIQDLVILKMSCERGVPSPEEQTRIADAHTALGMRDKLIASFPSWSNSPAKKMGAKITVNSVWGKHGQRPDMPKDVLIHDDDLTEYARLMANVSSNLTDLHSFGSVGESRTHYKTSEVWTNRYRKHHGTYLPMAVAVPAYGRMVLYEQLAKLGDRVLYHDTDSVMYIWRPDMYNIPVSDTLGEWEVEKCDSAHGGLRSFVGIGPKSYGIQGLQPCSPSCGCDIREPGQRYTCIKVKGLSIKHSHRNMLNFDIFKETVLKYINDHVTPDPLFLPQYTFNYKMGEGITTRYYLKRFAFQPELLKGKLHESTVYPEGYCEGCIRGWMGQDDHTCLTYRYQPFY